MKKQPTKEKIEKALVISNLSLSQAQQALVGVSTPKEFVKSRPIRGGKTAEYVETGYVVAMLNKIFGVVNWDFEIVEQGQTERVNESNAQGEVWVRGRLSIIDHKNGYRVSKTQYGQHNIHKSIPIGDAFKAASSDALKKCASMFGVAQDIYWSGSEEEQRSDAKKAAPATPQKPTEQQLFEKAKLVIGTFNEATVLEEMKKKLAGSELYTQAHRHQLIKLIDEKLGTQKQV